MHEERLETSVHSERIASEGAQTRHSIHHAPAAPVLPSSWIRGKKIDLGTLWRVFASLRKTLNQLGNAQKKKSARFTDFVDQGVVQSQIGSSRQRGEAFEKLLSVERKYSSACECDRNGWFPVSLHSKQGWIYFPWFSSLSKLSDKEEIQTISDTSAIKRRDAVFLVLISLKRISYPLYKGSSHKIRSNKQTAAVCVAESLPRPPPPPLPWAVYWALSCYFVDTVKGKVLASCPSFCLIRCDFCASVW